MWYHGHFRIAGALSWSERGVDVAEVEDIDQNTATLLFYNKLSQCNNGRPPSPQIRALWSISVDQSSSELLSSSASDKSAMGNRKMAATPLSWVSSETVEDKSIGDNTSSKLADFMSKYLSAKSVVAVGQLFLSILYFLNWGRHQ